MLSVGDTVMIKECHSLPQLVGRQAIVLKMGSPGKYPVLVQIAGESLMLSTGPTDTLPHSKVTALLK